VAATDYSGVKDTIAGMLATLVSDAVEGGYSVYHPQYAFQHRSAEETQAPPTSAGLRHFWFAAGAYRPGALAMGSGPQHAIRDFFLYVQYPATLRGLDNILGADEDMIRMRMQDTAALGWPDSGVLHIQYMHAARASEKPGVRITKHTLRVQYLAKQF